jgi:hypothetical protein
MEAIEGRKNYKFVCAAPCDIAVDLDKTYRIVGDGVRATGEFRLNAQNGQRVLIDVDTSSKGGFVWGIVIVSISPVVAVIGLVVYAVSSSDLVNSSSGQRTGAIIGIGGLAGIAIGIVLIATSSSSKASQSLQPQQPQPTPQREAAFGEGWRLPAPAPTMFNVPVVQF